tara:strand:+ start:796 stop:1305 length:510 start_codon:yes stop_codon:yes gene_type:complete
MTKPKKRRVLKKGKLVTTRNGEVVLALAKNLIKTLKPYSKKIQIAGSIRRKEKNPVDIDIVLIPKNKKKLESFLSKKGKYIQGGEKEATFKINGVKVELYYTIPEKWGATLLAYSSKAGAGIGLRIIAKKAGFKLNQHGLFKKGKYVAGKTEREIYKALGRPWKPAQDR